MHNNHQIHSDTSFRKVLKSLDCTVNRLIRIGYGTVSLGDLPYGKVEKLSENEVHKLVEVTERI